MNRRLHTGGVNDFPGLHVGFGGSVEVGEEEEDNRIAEGLHSGRCRIRAVAIDWRHGDRRGVFDLAGVVTHRVRTGISYFVGGGAGFELHSKKCPAVMQNHR